MRHYFAPILFVAFVLAYAFALYWPAGLIWVVLMALVSRTGQGTSWRFLALLILLIEQRVPPSYALLVGVSLWAGSRGNARSPSSWIADSLGGWLVLAAVLDLPHRFSLQSWGILILLASVAEFGRLLQALIFRFRGELAPTL